MKVISGLVVTVVSVFLLAAASAPATGPAPVPGPKNEQGLTAVLMADKATYTLDPAQSGKDFRDRLSPPGNARGGRGPAGGLPKPPAVDLTMRITNNSDKDVTIMVGGDDSQMQLKLAGPGAVTVENMVAMTMEFRIGKPVTIAPGKTYDTKITSLAFGMRGISQYAYWTEPGEYTLTATLVYGQGDGKPQGKVESGAAKLKVEAAK
jgi:hypothetical protein